MSLFGTWGYAGIRCKMKPGFKNAGRQGDALGYIEHRRLGEERWVAVIWDDRETPEFCKAEELKIKHPSERKWAECVDGNI